MKKLIHAVLILGIVLYYPQAMAKGGGHWSRLDTLSRACLREAENTPVEISTLHHILSATPHNPQIDHMKKICGDMSAEYASQDKEKHMLLAKQCSDEITEESQINPKNTKHFQSLQRICEEMTGQKILITDNPPTKPGSVK